MLNHLKVTYSNTTPDNAEFMANCIMQGAKHLKIKMRETVSQAKTDNLEGIKVTEIKLDDLVAANVEPVIDQVAHKRQPLSTKPQEQSNKQESYDFVGVAG